MHNEYKINSYLNLLNARTTFPAMQSTPKHALVTFPSDFCRADLTHDDMESKG